MDSDLISVTDEEFAARIREDELRREDVKEQQEEGLPGG